MGPVQARALLKWVLDHGGVVEMKGTGDNNPARPSDIETRLYTKEIDARIQDERRVLVLVKLINANSMETTTVD